MYYLLIPSATVLQDISVYLKNRDLKKDKVSKQVYI